MIFTPLRKLSDKLESADGGFAEAKVILSEVATIASLSARMVRNPKLSRTIDALSYTVTLGSVANQIYSYYKKQTAEEVFTIRIDEDDVIFEVAERWLNESLPEDKQRSIYLRSEEKSSGDFDVPEPDDRGVRDSLSIKMSFDGTIKQQVEIAGHPVIISTTMSEEKSRKMIGRPEMFGYAKPRTINFTFRTVDARDAIIQALTVEAKKLSQRSPVFNNVTSWGSYRQVKDIPMRSLESVILKEGQMDRILGSLRQFLENEESYVRTGIPYHTGLMLHGNPGSGKSSTASVIASELGLDIYYISLSTLENDDALSRALAAVPYYSVAVLEDVDVYKAVKKRKSSDDEDDSDASGSDSNKGVTMAGLLNVLDGFISPHGVITIMTTNHLAKLDPAIIRPGRVDLMEELNELDDYQLREMCKYFLGYVPDDLPYIEPSDGITSAEVVGIVRKHIPDIHNSSEDIVTFVREKLLNFTKELV